jgi:hypothetical protein
MWILNNFIFGIISLLYILMVKHIYKKSTKKRGKSKKRTMRNRRRKMKGGVTFNDEVTIRPIPYNEYLNDPSRDVITSRTLPFSQTGGKSKRKRGKGKKIRRSRKMKGGSLVGTDLVTGISTSNSNDVLAFGTTGGSQYMLQKLSGEEITTGENLTSDKHMVPMV